MPTPRRHAPIDDEIVARGLDAVFAELDVDEEFPAEALAEAAAAAPVDTADRDDRRDLDLRTIDPPGARDLDQAFAIEAVGGGHVVWYAIADVGAHVTPGGAVDRVSHERGVTLYAPGRRVPLHPPALSEGSASLLAGEDRLAVLWRLQLDADGALVELDARRAVVRSREQLDYATAQRRADAGDEVLGRLAVVGRRRLEIEADRGGVSLPVPEQEIERDGDGFRLRYRAALPVERWNAQLSLLCGMAAGQLALDGGWGLLRTLPPPDAGALDALRRQAGALGIEWRAGERYGDVVRRLDATVPAHAAFLVQATRLFRGAGYRVVGRGLPTDGDGLIHAAIAAPYSHVTAPLRRLGDRYATECALATIAGEDPPDHVVAALPDLPSTLGAGTARAGALERAVVDLVEALVLEGRVGHRLAGVVVDRRDDASIVQLREPAVVASIEDERPLGAAVEVVVRGVDPVGRRVELAFV